MAGYTPQSCSGWVLLLLFALASCCQAYQTSTLVLKNGSGNYSQTRDCDISTQYIAAYNLNNGE